MEWRKSGKNQGSTKPVLICGDLFPDWKIQYTKGFFLMNVIDTCAACNRFSQNIVFLSSLKCNFATWCLSNTGECNTTYMYLTKHSE